MRIRRCLLIILVAQVVISIFYSHSYALDKPTHEAINEYIAENTIGSFSLDQYLMDQLGFQKGKDEEFNNKKAFEWLGYGGKKEDEPIYFRSLRHFHDPTVEEWDKAGLKGIWDSSIIWAQRTDQWPGGHYSWQDVRDYFYSALISEDQTTRDYYFAETFRGLGQQMHLIEDASVPLHTRDDIHIIFNYEGWVEKFRTDSDDTEDIFNSWLANNQRYGYDKAVLNHNLSDLPDNAPIPIARIIDTDKYIGTNPDVAISAPVGIAEYSNANFFTEDTAFREYDYPAWDSVQIAEYEIPDPRDSLNMVFRQYYKKVSDGDTGYRLATVGYLKDYVLAYFPGYASLFRAYERPALDANVYRDYAERLIPRAVGYSAALLDYFFRGAIEISLPDTGVYGLIDPSDPPEQGFDHITLRAQNTSPEGEEMTDGSIELVVKYRLALADPFISYPDYVPYTEEFSYIVVPEASGTRSIPRESPGELDFDLSGNPIPLWATDLYLQVVYKGRLGPEDNAIGVGFKDISEPTPIDLFNSMDKVCLYENWYDAGSQKAIELVDADNNGIADPDEWDVYPDDIEDIYVRFSPGATCQYPTETEYSLYIPYLSAGDYIRVFLLSDYEFCMGLSEVPVVHTHPDDHFGYCWFPPGLHSITGIKHQTELELDPPRYIRYCPLITTFRGVDHWISLIFLHGPFPEDSSCSLDELE